MKTIVFLPLVLLFSVSNAQQNKELSLALTNSNSAFPFSKFGSLFKAPFHPGIEAGYGFNWKTGTKHDWFQQVKLGYFYHRFVQHGIPLYTNFGYRRKFGSQVFGEGSLGGGYFHSIPATGKFKLNSNGEYERNTGIGRMQAMMVFSISGGYTFKSEKENPVSVFITYQQRVQTPFIKSYVPMLPYNSFMMGVKKNMKKKLT
jgi:hypothetical protein